MLEDWAAGGDGDGAGGRVDPDLAWQPELWRRVAATIDGPTPVERHRETVAAIKAGSPLALPDRLSLFGYTRLAVTELELVAAVAEVARCTSGCRCPPPPPGTPSRRSSAAARPSARPTPPSSTSATRSPPRWEGTCARCSGPSPSPPGRLRPRPARHPAPRDARHPPRLAPARPAHRHRARPHHPRRPDPHRRRPVRPGPRHPRHPPPGRGAPRRAHRPAPGRPHPRAARHHRHVPGRRRLRAGHHRRVRARLAHRGRAPWPPAAGPARRPRPSGHQPRAGRRHRPRRHRRRARHRQRGARARGVAPGEQAVRASPTTTSRPPRPGPGRPACGGG